MEKSIRRRYWLASLLAVLCVTAVWRATFWRPQPIFAEEVVQLQGDSPEAKTLPFAITPKAADKSEPAPGNVSVLGSSLPPNASAQPAPGDEANLFQLDAPQKDFVMNLDEERTLRTAERISRVDGFDPTVIQVNAKSANMLAVKASTPGVTAFVVTDERGAKFAVTIRVDPTSHELQELLNWLYPDVRVSVIRVRESVLLRGIVSDPEQVSQFLEIAEQFFPKVLNQLKVAEKSERSAKPAAQKTMPAGVKAAKQKAAELQSLVDRLYPEAKVEVFTANDAVILRGSVAELEHLRQIEDLAEQLFPKVLNYANVTSRDGVSRTRAELFATALKERFPQARLKTNRPNHRLAVVVPSPLSEFDQEQFWKMRSEFSVSVDLQVDDTPRASVVPDRDAVPVAESKLPPLSGKISAPTAPVPTVEQELRSLHDDVRELRQDVRRLIEKLEKRVPKKSDSPKPQASGKESSSTEPVSSGT